MSLSLKQAGLTPLDIWQSCHNLDNPRIRLDRIKDTAKHFKQEFMKGQPVLSVRTLPTSIAPYPVTFAFNRACRLRYPFLLFHNKALLVQFLQNGVPKLLLMNPTIPERSAAAPFFRNLSEKLPFSNTVRHLLLESPPLPEQLQQLGIDVADIDYVAFDHQHVQDLRPYLGTHSEPPLYPNAKYLVQQADWDSSLHQHPLQRPWFVPGTGNDVLTDKLVLLHGDVQLGDGCVLLFTPGHTWGNQSLFFRAPETGCYTVSENGICMDAYTPQYSSIPGLAAHARKYGAEVIMNANTLEGSLDQYNSMVKEKLLADPYHGDGRFVQHFSSSELIHSAIAPGLKPTRAIREVNEGLLQTSGKSTTAV